MNIILRFLRWLFRRRENKPVEILPTGPVVINGRHTHEYYSHVKGAWRCIICGRMRINGKSPVKHKGCFGG